MVLIRFRDKEPFIKGVAANTARIIGDVKLGLNSVVWSYAVLRGDFGKIEVGNYCNIQEFCMLHADTRLVCSVGDHVTVTHCSILHSCKIGNHVFIGLGAKVMDNAEIGENCLIGAGSLILPETRIPDNSVVVGAPAKVLRECKEKDIEFIENSWRWYYELSKEYNFDLL